MTKEEIAAWVTQHHEGGILTGQFLEAFIIEVYNSALEDVEENLLTHVPHTDLTREFTMAIIEALKIK